MRYLIPLAATHNLFPSEEFHFPKPLIEIEGKPMIVLVIENILRFDKEAEFIFIVRDEDCRSFDLDRVLSISTDGRCLIVRLSTPTLGAACSSLMAIDEIDEVAPLVVYNGDQIINADITAVSEMFLRKGMDAGVITFPSVHPRWSYVRTDPSGQVVEAAEKRVLSREAIAGFYFFRTGRLFIDSVQDSIRKGNSVNGMFYIAPTLNEVVLRGGKIGAFAIEETQYHSFYSPQRVEYYLSHRTSVSAPKPLQVVVPMAGLGSRFSKAGYTDPKPFIDVAGKPMIERVIDNLSVSEGTRYILICRREHLQAAPNTARALENRGDVAFVPIDLTTEGAACTVLTAREKIDPTAPLLIANCDQIVDFDCSDFVADASQRGLDGSILCFRDPTRDPKWSFAKLDESQMVTEVREKIAISDLATVGLYWFRTAETFINAAIDMISRNERVNNEFYVCPVYNFALKTGARVGVYEVAQERMHGIGTPADLEDYLAILQRRS